MDSTLNPTRFPPSQRQPAALHYSTYQPAKPRPVRVRYRRSIDEVLKLAIANVDRNGKTLNLGRFNPVLRGRPLTRGEKCFMGAVVAVFGLAVWIQARPEPSNAHTSYYQSLALTAGRDASSVQAFTESAVQAIGKKWKPATLFAQVDPLFWRRTPAVDANALARGVEAGLAGLAGHGPVVSATLFSTPELGTAARGDGADAVVSRVAGQVELADGTVVRLAALLIQNDKSKQWGILELSLPPFLP